MVKPEKMRTFAELPKLKKMSLVASEIQEKKVGKELYAYQLDAIDKIFERLQNFPEGHNLLYQLPTGGGKTVIFSEIAKRYIKYIGKSIDPHTSYVGIIKQMALWILLGNFMARQAHLELMPEQQ